MKTKRGLWILRFMRLVRRRFRPIYHQTVIEYRHYDTCEKIQVLDAPEGSTIYIELETSSAHVAYDIKKQLGERFGSKYKFIISFGARITSITKP